MSIDDVPMTPLEKRWTLLLILGILAIAVGLIILLWTGMSVTIYVIFTGVLALIGGISELLILGEFKDLRVARPVIMIILGILMIVIPFIMAEVSAIIFAIFFVLFGVALLFGFSDPDKIQVLSGRILGFIMIVVGILIIVFPKQAVEIMAIIFGVMLIIIGLASVITAVQIRRALSY